jgi:hypothetical protein
VQCKAACKAARNDPKQGLGPQDLGFLICINGIKCGCITNLGLEGSGDIFEDARKCILVHELTHGPATPPCPPGPCGRSKVFFLPTINPADEECKAAAAEIKCLEKALATYSLPWKTYTIEQRIKDAKDYCASKGGDITKWLNK